MTASVFNTLKLNQAVILCAVIAAMMKHFEMNPYTYGSSVTVHKDNAGQQYLAISGSKFESRVENMFGRSILASACPGYLDGTIYVCADSAGKPIQVFASPTSCFYLGNNAYETEFNLYQVSSVTSQDYASCFMNHDENPDCKKIGTGVATLYYYGSNSATEFNAVDFTLERFSMSAEKVSTEIQMTLTVSKNRSRSRTSRRRQRLQRQ